MTKERREKLREAVEQDLRNKLIHSQHLTISTRELTIYELRALLDSDERLEAWESTRIELLPDAAEGHNRIKTVANEENEQPSEGR